MKHPKAIDMSMDKSAGLKAHWRRIIERTSIRNEKGCWIWQGRMIKTGYGKLNLNIGLQEVLAHRMSYAEFKGPIRKGYETHHICENKRCVNPEHIEQMTN
jgi:hypothetical protein